MFETRIDFDFVHAMQSLARSTEKIADSLDKMDSAKAVTDEQVKEIIKSYPKEDLLELLNYDQKDYIYRSVWANHVAEDVASKFSEFDENICDTVAKRYAFDGDYDCNRDYWSNLETLLNEVKGAN
jgi:hypothetical protein